MPLPNISVPTYELKFPSDGTKIKYRPFLVKEQKLLLIAQEGNDDEEIISAIKELLSNCCVEGDLNIDDRPTFDIEYFFLNLRSKSVGEKVELYFRHQECPENNGMPAKNQTEITVDLSKVEVKKEEKHSNKIKLTDDVGIIMQYPKIETSVFVSNPNNIELALNVIKDCIGQIYDSETVYTSQDYTPEELDEFVSNMTEEQFTKIKNFFDTIPKLKHTVEFVCADCKFKDSVEVEGLQSFFI